MPKHDPIGEESDVEYSFVRVRSPDGKLNIDGVDCTPFTDFADKFIAESGFKAHQGFTMITCYLATQAATLDVEEGDNYFLQMIGHLLGKMYSDTAAALLSEHRTIN